MKWHSLRQKRNYLYTGISRITECFDDYAGKGYKFQGVPELEPTRIQRFQRSLNFWHYLHQNAALTGLLGLK
jgi:hypothetical protein